MIYEYPPIDFNPKVSVASCFIEHGDQVLFVLRAANVALQPGTWGIPGGKLEKDETPEQAVCREIQEECGFSLKNPIFLHTVYIRYPNLDYIYHMYREVVAEKPVIKLDLKENAQCKWLTRDEVNKLDAEGTLILDEMPCIDLVYKKHAFGMLPATKSICVFCSGDEKVSAKYQQLAYDLGVALAKHNCALVTGGGRNGLMGFVNNGHAAIQDTVHRYGVIPEIFREFDVQHREIHEDNLHWVDTTHQRLINMYQLCDDVVVLPGGFGTLHELMDCLVHNQYGLHKKHIYLFNIDNFWQPFIEQCKLMVAQKTLAPHHFEYITIVHSIDELLHHIKTHAPFDKQQGFADLHWEKEQLVDL